VTHGEPPVEVRVKRVYEPATADDGYRVLADRLWPRGISREAASIDAWEAELAPSTPLRRWYGHNPVRFEEFRELYLDELRRKGPLVRALLERARGVGALTLVYAASDRRQNNAVVLAEALRRLGRVDGDARRGRCSARPMPPE
jgi:uncharacterized protein YeaO (DUF488 family)